MNDKIKVELLREIKHGENGKTFKYSPAKRGVTKHTMIPRSMYEALKNTNPPHFKVAQAVIIEEVGAEVVEATTPSIPNSVKTGNETVAPVADIDYAEPGEEDDNTPTIPVAPLAEDASVEDIQVQALEQINGVGSALARNLVQAGYLTIADVSVTSAMELDDIKGIHKGNVDHIIAKAKELVA